MIKSQLELPNKNTLELREGNLLEKKAQKNCEGREQTFFVPAPQPPLI